MAKAKRQYSTPYELICYDHQGNQKVYEYYRTKAQAIKKGKEYKATDQYEVVIVQYVSDTQIEDEWTL